MKRSSAALPFPSLLPPVNHLRQWGMTRALDPSPAVETPTTDRPRHRAPRPGFLLKLLRRFVLLGVGLYVFAWLFGPSMDMYLPPRHPCHTSMMKPRQMRTMADLRNTTTALTSWMDDARPGGRVEAELPASVRLGDYVQVPYETVRSLLHPAEDFYYMQEIPERDGWDNPFEFFFLAAKDAHGSAVPEDMLIRSLGCDGEPDGDVYAVGSFPSIEYRRDIVWSVHGPLRRPDGIDRPDEPRTQ